VIRNISGSGGNQVCEIYEIVSCFKAFKCDSDADCVDGSDEESCFKGSSCSPYHWKCTSGDCIYHRFRCDADVGKYKFQNHNSIFRT
jgi:hypothetical protein